MKTSRLVLIGALSLAAFNALSQPAPGAPVRIANGTSAPKSAERAAMPANAQTDALEARMQATFKKLGEAKGDERTSNALKQELMKNMQELQALRRGIVEAGPAPSTAGSQGQPPALPKAMFKVPPAGAGQAAPVR